VLEPGPYVPIDLQSLRLDPEPPGWEEYETAELGRLDVLDRALADDEQTAVPPGGAPPRDVLEQPLGEAAYGLAVEQDPRASPDMSDAFAADQEVTDHVLGAHAEIPPEAWQPVPPPFGPPPDMPGFTELPDPAGSGGGPGGVPPYPGELNPWAGQVLVTLVNQRAPGTNVFRVGDSWKLTVYGPASQTVEVEAGRPPAPPSRSWMGMTDERGIFELWGLMEAEHVGHWEELWYVGGVQAQPPLSFDVIP